MKVTEYTANVTAYLSCCNGPIKIELPYLEEKYDPYELAEMIIENLEIQIESVEWSEKEVEI